MFKSIALTMSLAANGLWLATWLKDGELRSAPAIGRDLAAPTAVNEAGLPSRRAADLTEHEVKTLLFAQLERAALGDIGSPWAKYWEVTDPALDYAVAVSAAYEAIRAALRERFGVGAEDSPEFQRAFRPLQAQLPFLSSVEQVELQNRRLERGIRRTLSALLGQVSLAQHLEGTAQFRQIHAAGCARELAGFERRRTSSRGRLLRGQSRVERLAGAAQHPNLARDQREDAQRGLPVV